MPDIETAPAAETAAPATETTTTEPTRAPTIDDVKQARRAAAKLATSAPATEEKPANDNAASTETKTEAKPETTEIDMDEKSLAQFTTLNRDLRASRAKTKELEDRLANFSKFERAEKLAKEGKHYDAAREAGIDVDQALAELLGQNAPKTEESEVAKMKKDLEQLQKEREDERKAKEDAQKQDVATRKERAKQGIVDYVGKNAEKYAYLSKDSDLVHAALKDADAAYEKIKSKLPEGEDVSDDDKNQILLDALDVHEEKWASKFGGVKKDEKKVPGFDNSLRGGVTETAKKLPEKMTYEEVKAARRAAGKR